MNAVKRVSRRTCLGLLAAGAASAMADVPFVAGFVYNGPKNDLGYNQAHAEGK